MVARSLELYPTPSLSYVEIAICLTANARRPIQSELVFIFCRFSLIQ